MDISGSGPLNEWEENKTEFHEKSTYEWISENKDYLIRFVAHKHHYSIVLYEYYYSILLDSYQKGGEIIVSKTVEEYDDAIQVAEEFARDPERYLISKGEPTTC